MIWFKIWFILEFEKVIYIEIVCWNDFDNITNFQLRPTACDYKHDYNHFFDYDFVIVIIVENDMIFWLFIKICAIIFV